MTIEIIKGVALLLALCMLQSINLRLLRERLLLSDLVGGLLFGLICVAGMMAPLVVMPGMILDARSVVLACAGLFGGPVVGGIAALIASAFRVYLGGQGVLAGVAAITICTLLGLAYRWLHTRGWVGLGLGSLLFFAVLTHSAIGAVLYFALPAVVAVAVAEQFLPVVMLVFPAATVMLGLILKDANDRVATERSLRSTSARLRSIGSAIPDLLLILDEDGRYLEILSGSSSLLYADAEVLRGRLMHDVLPRADADLFLSQVHKTIALGTTEAFEYDLVTQLGKRHFEARLHPLEAEPDRKRAVVFVARDITERHESQMRLQASELRFRELLQNIPSMAVQGYTAAGTTVYWNAASERLYGYTAQEALGRNLLDLIVPEPLQAQMLTSARQMEETGQAIGPLELMLRSKDGAQVPVYCSHAVVKQADGSTTLFCFDIDLTERKRTESELRIAAIAFEAQEGMMVSDAEHTILRVNHAFTSITGYAPEEVLGKKPDMLASGWHDEKFFSAMYGELEGNGRWEGEVWSRRKDGEVYPQWLNITAVVDANGILINYVATFVDITHRKAAEDQIRRLAFYDSLTGLPNRRLLMDRLHHAMATSARSGQYSALLFIDLDHFKTLNDTMGHDKGDLLLQQVGQRLIETVREEDTVARLGGDEFVVMLEGLGQTPTDAAARATNLGEKLIAVLNNAYQLAGADYHSTPSIGVTLFSGHEVGIDDLLKHADLAMYQAKSAGRNGMRFFDPQMQASVSQRASLEKDIRRGILLGQFLLFYQPQVDAAGRVVGAEALLRWGHPERGMVSPGDFIPVAEESGHIIALGSWVLEAACAQLLVWASDPVTEHLTLAVNVSARQFRQPDFADYVLGLLDYTGANPRRLKLELTESLLAENLEDVIVKMEALRARGVGFSLDDFGTGYSSLSYLKRLPLDQLKIDQSFVADVLTDPNDASIAQTIVALGRGLGLAVIAEGVETEAQRNFLLQAGCETYQGYLFSRPIPADQFDRYIKTGLAH